LTENTPIIPPTWRKTAAGETVFARLLGEALKHMRLAARIVIVGYSMPNTDSYFRYLLAEALGTPTLPSIEVWDINREHMQQRVEAMFGSKVMRRTYVADTGFVGLVRHKVNPNSLAYA
jgi:hypothetical protein